MNSRIGCSEARICRCDLDCEKTLRGVQKKCESAERRRLTRDIGCADVAASAAPDIFTTKDADEKIAERNRSEKIAGDEDEDYFLHAFS